MEPRGSVPRIRKSYFYMFFAVAPITVAAIFYILFEEVTAYQKTEKVQADPFYVQRLLLR